MDNPQTEATRIIDIDIEADSLRAIINIAATPTKAPTDPKVLATMAHSVLNLACVGLKALVGIQGQLTHANWLEERRQEAEKWGNR